MCNFWSAILTRDGKVLWDKDIETHSELITKFGLKDDKLENRDFVRIEVAPKNIMSKKKSDWVFTLDEPKTIPSWYEEASAAHNLTVWTEWRKMITAMHKDIADAGLNLDRMKAIEERCKTMKPGNATVSRSTVNASINEYVKRLKALDKEKREWGIKSVAFHTPAEWSSIWSSIRSSIWSSIWSSIESSIESSIGSSIRLSIWSSIRSSIWSSIIYNDEDNYGMPLIDCMESGCVFIGVDRDGVAHIVMVGKEG